MTTTDIPVCAHRWRIAPPNGPLSEGVCRYCGAVRHFANGPADAGFLRDDQPRPAPRGGAMIRKDDEQAA